MPKIKLDGKEFDVAVLTESSKFMLENLQFIEQRVNELNNTIALLHRAKNSYIDGIKSEILADKSGFLFGEE